MRALGARKEFEADFGVGEKEGTLVLTNRRLIFVCTDEKEDDLASESGLNPLGEIRIVYSDVEDVDRVPKEPPNIFIPIASISSVKGHRGAVGRPGLEVHWNDKEIGSASVFTEMLTGRRSRNLNDWAPIIEMLKAGTLKLKALNPVPSADSLEGKVMRVMADMQEKGVFVIEDAVEIEFKIEADPDEIQAACDSLSSQGQLVRNPDSSGEVYYRRVSPLEDNLSS